MQRELPNLDWLRVFDACAETSSFASAAERLRVTPGAVSQRIKALEAFLGIALFERQAQGVRLTAAGRRFAADVRPGVRQLMHATREVVRNQAHATIRISVLPALAQLWLGPRLADFHRRHEGVSVEIWADAALADLRAASFDLALRYGRPPFADCEHQTFLADALVPVASPDLLARCRRDVHGLPIGEPLLLDTYWPEDFGDWMRAARITHDALPSTRTFSLYSMVVDAALDGQGFMIGHTALVGDLLASGRLVRISDVSVPTAHQFHVLSAQDRPIPPSAALFVAWLLAQKGNGTTVGGGKT